MKLKTLPILSSTSKKHHAKSISRILALTASLTVIIGCASNPPNYSRGLDSDADARLQ